MRLKVNYFVGGKPDRILFVERLANLLNGGNLFVPFRPNEDDWDYWILDQSNNWKVKFYEDNTFEIIYRYGSDPAEKFSNWLTFKILAIIVNDEMNILYKPK